MGLVVVEGLHLVVKGDAGDLGLAGEAAADHEDDAEFAERMGEAEGEAGEQAVACERDMHAQERAQRRGARGAGGIEEFAGHAAQCGLKRLHGEWQRVNDRGDEESGETEDERAAGEMQPPGARRVVGRQCDQQVKSDDRGREDEGERDERLGDECAAPTGGV